MTTFSRCIAAATLSCAMALAPGLAAADDDDDDDRDERKERFERQDRNEWADRRSQDPRDDLRWNERGRFGARWERRERHGRFLQVRAVRCGLFELERERAGFHARHAYRPWLLARYDAGYFERRAALERRLERLTTYAWR